MDSRRLGDSWWCMSWRNTTDVRRARVEIVQDERDEMGQSTPPVSESRSSRTTWVYRMKLGRSPPPPPNPAPLPPALELGPELDGRLELPEVEALDMEMLLLRRCPNFPSSPFSVCEPVPAYVWRRTRNDRHRLSHSRTSSTLLSPRGLAR